LPHTLLGGAYSTPRLPSWIKGPTSKGRGKRRERGGKEMGREGMRGKMRGEEGRDFDPHNVGNRLTPLRMCKSSPKFGF